MSPVTIDELGQVQLPKLVQEQLGLSNQTALALEIENGKIILTPIFEQPKTYYKKGVLVVEAEFTEDTDGDTDILETISEERIQEFLT